MYLGLITKNGIVKEVVNINATEEYHGKKALAEYIESKKETGLDSAFINTVDLKVITRKKDK